MEILSAVPLRLLLGSRSQTYRYKSTDTLPCNVGETAVYY